MVTMATNNSLIAPPHPKAAVDHRQQGVTSDLYRRLSGCLESGGQSGGRRAKPRRLADRIGFAEAAVPDSAFTPVANLWRIRSSAIC